MKNKSLTIILVIISMIFSFVTCAYAILNMININKTIAVATSNTKNYYVSTSGNDKNDGSSPNKSVRTLYKAIELIQKSEKADTKNEIKTINIYIKR